jgi:hypothetical protein
MALNFNTEPYYDDFNKDKDFYRILFRPGYAVQARELTQMQTILQSQVSRFGDHIFKNGSQVIPGSVNYDNQVHFLKLEPTYNSQNVISYLTTFRNKIITGVTSGVKFQVIDTSECGCVTESRDIATLYCKVIGTAADGITNRFIPGEDIVALEADNTVANNPKLTIDQSGDIYAEIRNLGDTGQSPTTYTDNPSSDVIGFAFQVDVKAGIYYFDGFFIQNPELHLYVGRFNRFPTARVCFNVIEEIVTPEDDQTLLDNAQNSFNYAAPGASRYKVSVELVKTTLQSTDTGRLIELLRIVNGKVQQIISKASYAELEKTLARRTFDESGNYEVNKFKMGVREHLDNGSNGGLYPEIPISGAVAGNTYGDSDKFILAIEPGKAYIQGYEVESINTQYVPLNKARENSITGDEGGHIFRLEDQPIGLPMGNYVLVNNVYKYPNLSNFEQVYLVQKLNSSAGAAPAPSDIIGTARIKFINLHSSDYSGGTSTQFKLGLFDININSGYSFEKDVKQIVGRATSDNFSCNIVPTLLNLDGSATTSTSSTTVTGVGTIFTQSVNVGDVVYVNNIQIGRVSSVGSNLALTLDANATTTITGGRISVFRAEIQEPQYDSLLFKTGLQFTKTLRGFDGTADTLKSSQVTIKRVFTGLSSNASGIYTAELTNVKEFFLSDSILGNYLLIDEVTKLPVNISESAITFDNDADRKIVNISGLTNSRAYRLIASVLQIQTAGAEKTKTLVQDYALDVITGKKTLTNSIIELRKADVLRIKNVYMTPGNYDTFNTANQIDITDRFTLDDGQRPSYYTNAKLVLKPGYQVPSGAIKVVYDYFQASGTGNYFSVDSYYPLEYDAIPNYYVTDENTGQKTEICLSCVLDFRPILAGENVFYPELPVRGVDANAPIAYYVGRKDKITIDSTGRFNVISGVPAKIPQDPEDPKDGLVLATVYVPPYTKILDHIKVYQRDNRRYTMKDIGNIDRRVSNLEYYVSLSLLEKNTETLQIKDSITGLDRFKNGFIVDQFTGHNIGDVIHPDYKIAVDSSAKIMRPMHFTTAVDIIEDLSSGAARSSAQYKKTNDLITLPYTETLFVYNQNASRAIDVNPYKIGAFRGQLTLFPEGDNWKDIDRRPDLNVVDDNNYDAIKFMAEQLGVTGTKWEEWKTNWTGSSSTSTNFETTSGFITQGFQQTITTETGTTSRNGVTTSLTSSVNAIDYGDRVVDVSFTPYMRSRPVTVIAENLKPDTIFYPFFDSTFVDSYVIPADIVRVTRNSGSAITSFEIANLQNNTLYDDPARMYNGKVEPAFSAGDILKNSTHTATNITAITNLTSAAASFQLTVASSSGILPGHHVCFYNLDFHVAKAADLFDDTVIPASVGITSTTSTSKELNLRKFKVTAVSGTTITLANIDGSNISAFSAYSTASYSGSNRGKLLRLQASGVVSFGGVVYAVDSSGYPTDTDINLVNIKNGFAVGEILLGTTNIGTSTNKNAVTITTYNNSTSATAAPPVNVLGSNIRTNAYGDAVAVFYIPNTPELAFRTGERTFKLVDNISNTDASFDSHGTTTYYSQGVTLTKESTIVSSRQATFVQDRLYESIPARRSSVSNRLLYTIDNTPSGDGGGGDGGGGGGDGGGGGGGGHDPLAQTFTVVSDGGAFVTSVDLFFKQAGKRPVIVELRTTNNGVPSTKIIPLSTSIKDSSELKISENGLVATRFDFQAPVFLQNGETYALVLKTDEPGCEAFVSELGQDDLITNNVISRQPLTGSLYLSQNSLEFEINPKLDLKFTLRKAVFTTNTFVSVPLKASLPETYVLPLNPFEITPNTNKVRVHAPNHGFTTGQTVLLSGLPTGYYGTAVSSTGIPSRLFNTSHVVLSDGLEKDSFIIELNTLDENSNSMLIGTNANFVKGEYGGSTIRCTRGLFADGIYLKTSDLTFQDTALSYALDIEDTSGLFTGPLQIVPNSNYYFNTRKHIKSYENQAVITVSPLLKKSSLTFAATMISTNPNVSPVIDLQKLTTYVISNMIDNKTQSNTNVSVIDDRSLLQYSNIVDGDVTATGTGSLTSSTASTAITGTSTLFLTQVAAGNILKRVSDGATIGTVSTVNSNTSITLTGNAAITIASPVSYNISSPATLSFTNSGDTGIISTNIDTADNLLSNAVIGKYITISNAHSNVNGTYVIKNVINQTDSSTFSGNSELDKINVIVSPAFPGSASIDMITDNDFSIVMKDKYVEDFAPIGSTNAANYITRPLSLANAAEALKIIFDACILAKTTVKVYYRIWGGDADLRYLRWIDTGWENSQFNQEDIFTERNIDLSNLTQFTNVSLKIVMRSTDPSQVPKIKNLRMIAHS